MRADAAELARHEAVDEVELLIEPGKEFVFDFVMHGKRDFRETRPNFREIDEAEEVNISADRFESVFIGRFAVHRCEDGARFKAQRTAKAKIDRLRRCNRGFRDHQKLPAVGLNAGKTRFALSQWLTHVKGFFKEHILLVGLLSAVSKQCRCHDIFPQHKRPRRAIFMSLLFTFVSGPQTSMRSPWTRSFAANWPATQTHFPLTR
jgi:hypothetical protein